MANTVLSNTNLDWITNKFTAPLDAEYDIYTWTGNSLGFSQNFNASEIENSIGVESHQYERTGTIVIVAWREANTTTSYSGNREELSEGWA